MNANKVNKQQLSEARRRESIKLKQLERSSQQKKISDLLRNSNIFSSSKNVTKLSAEINSSNLNKDHGSSPSTSPAKKLAIQLIESSDSEDEENDTDDEHIKIKPQSKGKKGKQITFSSNKNIANLKTTIDDRSARKDQESNANLSHSTNKTKMQLLNSSESEGDEDDDIRFKIKPQFEGERGRQLFEMSSSIADERFKFDVRFKEDETFEAEDNLVNGESASECDIDENLGHDDNLSLKQEKGKNLSILEQVLGFKMPQKPPEEKVQKKREYIRFDPEGESASAYITKKEEDGAEPKKKKKKVKIMKEPEPLPVVSKETFYEVAPDLKEVLQNSEPFSFAHQFNFAVEDPSPSAAENEDTETVTADIQDFSEPEKEQKSMDNQVAISNENHQRLTFFIRPNDPRLKEGVEFFRRTKSMEEIRNKWLASREEVMGMLRKNRQKAQKMQTAQRTVQKQKYGKKTFYKKKRFVRTPRLYKQQKK